MPKKNSPKTPKKPTSRAKSHVRKHWGKHPKAMKKLR